MVKPLTEVSCAIILDGEMVLATQRSYFMPHPYKWEFPGGKLLTGETPEACIIREIREELGVEISVIKLLPSVKHVDSDHALKLIPFVCSITEGEISLTEHRLYRWVHLSQLEEIDWLEADVEVVKLVKKYC